MFFYINRVLTYSNGLYIRLASLKDLNYNIKQDIDINFSKQTVITDFFLSE